MWYIYIGDMAPLSPSQIVKFLYPLRCTRARDFVVWIITVRPAISCFVLP